MMFRAVIGIMIAAAVIPAAIIAASIGKAMEGASTQERAAILGLTATAHHEGRREAVSAAATARKEDFHRARATVMAMPTAVAEAMPTADATREAISARVTATTTAYRNKEKQRDAAKERATAEAKEWNAKYPVAATQTALRQRSAEREATYVAGSWRGGGFKPRPCEWKMMSLNDGYRNPRSPSECWDGSLHYGLDDFVFDEQWGRMDLPDHHPARFYPLPSPTPTR